MRLKKFIQAKEVKTDGFYTSTYSSCHYGNTYLIGYASKQIPQVKDNIIPIIVGVAGGILGIAGMFVIPGYPADNILDAIAVGIVSGMASTGVNQIYKQVKNNA